METSETGPVLGQGHPIFRIEETVRRGRKSLSAGRLSPRTSHVVVAGERVVAADLPGWEGLDWRRLRERIEASGGVVSQVPERGPLCQETDYTVKARARQERRRETERLRKERRREADRAAQAAAEVAG